MIDWVNTVSGARHGEVKIFNNVKKLVSFVSVSVSNTKSFCVCVVRYQKRKVVAASKLLLLFGNALLCVGFTVNSVPFVGIHVVYL